MSMPTKFNPENCKIIIDATRRGYPLELAAQLAKVARTTIILWCNRGKEEEESGGGPYADFMLELRKAEAEIVGQWIDAVNAGSFGWQSAAWALERRHWQHFGRRSPIENNTDSKPTQVVFHLGAETKEIKGDSLTSDENK